MTTLHVFSIWQKFSKEKLFDHYQITYSNLISGLELLRTEACGLTSGRSGSNVSILMAEHDNGERGIRESLIALKLALFFHIITNLCIYSIILVPVHLDLKTLPH